MREAAQVFAVADDTLSASTTINEVNYYDLKETAGTQVGGKGGMLPKRWGSLSFRPNRRLQDGSPPSSWL